MKLQVFLVIYFRYALQNMRALSLFSHIRMNACIEIFFFFRFETQFDRKIAMNNNNKKVSYLARLNDDDDDDLPSESFFLFSFRILASMDHHYYY